MKRDVTILLICFVGGLLIVTVSTLANILLDVDWFAFSSLAGGGMMGWSAVMLWYERKHWRLKQQEQAFYDAMIDNDDWWPKP